MPNAQVLPGQSLICGVGGLLADLSTKAPLSAASATIDNYTAAYVAAVPTSTIDDSYQAWFNVVPKNVPTGVTVTVTVTVHAKSADGTDLPPSAISVDLVGPPEPPQAESIQIVSASPSAQFANSSTDPGSPTAVLI